MRPVTLGEALTPREIEILAHLSAGLTNRQIGRLFGINEESTKAAVGRVMRKLGAQNRAHAVHLAYQARILQVLP